MSTLIISAIFIVLIMLVFFVFIFINKKNKRNKQQRLALKFSHAGTMHGLSFSSQEILGSKIIGLDGIHRKLVLVRESAPETVIALDEVTKCEVVSAFQTYQIGDSKSKDTERHLTSIALLFHFKKTNNPISIQFYNSMTDSVYEAAALEAKANDWSVLLSKLLQPPKEIRA